MPRSIAPGRPQGEGQRQASVITFRAPTAEPAAVPLAAGKLLHLPKPLRKPRTAR